MGAPLCGAGVCAELLWGAWVGDVVVCGGGEFPSIGLVVGGVVPTVGRAEGVGGRGSIGYGVGLDVAGILLSLSFLPRVKANAIPTIPPTRIHRALATHGSVFSDCGWRYC